MSGIESLAQDAAAMALAKLTLLLAAAWIAHAALRSGNPRWRTGLWRGATVGGLLLIALAGFGPRLPLSILPPLPAASIPAAMASASPFQSADPNMIAPSGAVVQKQQIVPQTDTSAAQNQALDGESAQRPTAPEQPRPRLAPFPAPAPPLARSLAPRIGGIAGHPLKTPLALAWLLVALMLTLRAWLTRCNLVRNLGETRPAPASLDAMLRRIADRMGYRGSILLRVGEGTFSPYLAERWTPVIVIPESMADPAFADELPSVLAHETAHLKENDLGWMMAIRALQIALWWHPLAWRIGAAHGAACELVCDRAAAELCGEEPYAQTLARVALALAQATPARGLAFARPAQIVRRLQWLARSAKAAPLPRWLKLLSNAFGLAFVVLLGALQLEHAIAQPAPNPANASGEAGSLDSDALRTIYALHKEAVRTIEGGDLRGAREIWNRILAIDPNNKLAMTWLENTDEVFSQLQANQALQAAAAKNLQTAGNLLDSPVSISTASEVSLKEFMNSLTFAVPGDSFNYRIANGADAVVYAKFKDTPLRKVLDSILEPAGLTWSIGDDNTIVISKGWSRRTFPLASGQWSRVQALMNSGMLQQMIWGEAPRIPSWFCLILDRGKSTLAVEGLPPTLQSVEKLLPLLTQERASNAEPNLMHTAGVDSQTFNINGAEPETIRQAVEPLLQSANASSSLIRWLSIDNEHLTIQDTSETVKRVETTLAAKGYLVEPGHIRAAASQALVTQFYKIREADGERIRAQIKTIIPPTDDPVLNSERKIYIDGNDLIVRDTAENIKKIEVLLIDKGFVSGPRDMSLDIRSYSLAPRNIETIKSDVVKNFTSHVVETIRTFLYADGGEGNAAKQGRRWWFNEDSFLLTVIDTPGNLDQIDDYLNTLPQLPRNAGKTLDAATTVSLNRGENRPVFNAIIRLIRVVPHESPDHRSDSAQIQINVGNQVQTATLQEGQTQTVGDYMIAADDIQPSGLDESGEGRVQLTMQYAPLVRLIPNISDGPSLKPQPPAGRPSSLPKAPAAAAATTHTAMRLTATPLATAHYRIRKTDTDRVRSLIYSVVGSRTAADDAARSTINIDGEYLTVRDTLEHLSSIEKLVNQQGLARNLRDDGLELESFSLVPKEVATLDDAVVKTFASQVVEAVGVFLYAKSGGSQAAEAEGRRLWFDADSMQMSIVDRPENLKRVAGYVDSLPQIEKKRQQRVVRLNHALAADLAASLERSLDIHADPVAGAANVPVPPITINPVKELNALVIRYTDETKYQDAMDLIRQLDQPVAVIRVKTTIAVFSREAGERLRLSASPPPEGWNVYFKAMATGAEKGALKDMHPAPNGVSVFQGPETAATSGTRAGFHLATRGANPALDESLDLHLTPEMTGDRSIVLRDVAFEWNAIEATRLETASIKLAAGGSAILASPGINRAGERVFVALSAEPADPAEPRPPAPPQAPLPPQ